VVNGEIEIGGVSERGGWRGVDRPPMGISERYTVIVAGGGCSEVSCKAVLGRRRAIATIRSLR